MQSARDKAVIAIYCGNASEFRYIDKKFPRDCRVYSGVHFIYFLTLYFGNTNPRFKRQIWQIFDENYSDSLYKFYYQKMVIQPEIPEISDWFEIVYEITARVGGASPSTIDAWQCFLMDIRDYIKEWLLCFYCPSLSPSLMIGPWDVEYVSVVLFCYILDVMLCCVKKIK